MMNGSPLEGAVRKFQLVLSTTDTINVGLGFRAAEVQIDNFSDQYIYVADAATWCPPQTQGYVLPLIASPTARAEWNTTLGTPPGITAAAVVAGQVAVLTFRERRAPGTSITQRITVVASTSVDGTGINVSAALTEVAASTQSTQAIAATASLRLLGWNVRENAGATARVILHAGTSVGTVIMDRNLLANESFTDWLGDAGIAPTTQGIFLERPSGNTGVIIYTKTVA